MKNKILFTFVLVLAIALVCVSAQRNIMMPGGFGPGVSDFQGTVTTAGSTAGPAEAVLFADLNQRGDHKHIFEFDSDIRADNDFVGSPRSMVVLSGVWRIYKEANFQNPYDMEFGPGIYPSLGDHGINEIASMKRLR